MGDALAEQWLIAARTPVIAGALEGIYADVAREVEARGPACWASGRCCNFRETGHLLYVTGLEAAYCVARAAGASEEAARGGTLSLQVLSAGTLAGASASGGCPFQRGNLCGVHTIKPLGCRVYFCDRSAQEWQQDLSERMLERIRGVHDVHGVEYRYGEWRGMLGRFVGTT